MAAKVVKLAVVPAALGLASFKVYTVTKERTDEQISPRELSIYNTEPLALQYVEEKAGHLQTGFGQMRLGLQRFVRSVQNTCTSVRVGAVSLYQTGHDTYNFLRDPPPGFLPRVGIITVSGLAGLILARKGSRLKRIGVPLVMTTAGTAVCYPLHTVGVLQVTAKTLYAASSLVASAFKSNSKVDGVIPEKSHTSEEDGPGTEVPQPDELPQKLPKGEPVPETAPFTNVVEGLDISDNLPESAAPPTDTATLVEETTPPPPAVEETTPPPPAVEETTPPPPAVEETTPPPPAVEETTPPPPAEEETTPPPPAVEETTPPPPAVEETTPPPPAVEETTPPPPAVEETTPPPPAVEETTPPPPAVEETTPPPPAVEETTPPPPAVEETTPPPPAVEETTPPPPAVEETTPPPPAVEETTPPPPAVEETTPPPPAVEETTPPPPAVEETTPPPPAVEETTPPPPAVEETTPPPPAVEITTSPTAKEKPRFVPDPSLLDHGQAHPEDSDLYSTRG